MFIEEEVELLLSKYDRSSEDVERMKKRISNRQKEFKRQAKSREVSTEKLLIQYDV